MKLSSSKKEVELKILSEENMIMSPELTVMTPDRRAWFKEKQKLIQDGS
jgi:hypothetical protein